MSNSKGNALIGMLLVLAVFAVSAYGYVENIIKFVAHVHQSFDALEVVRVIGIVIPVLGIILGYV